MSEQKHVHTEAFALMDYAGGGKRVTAWNSRDGVTPFIIRHEGAVLEHVNFGTDRYAPEHVPEPGELVFIDLTHRLAQQITDEFMKANWESMREQPQYADEGFDHARARTATRYLQEADGGAPYYLAATREFCHAVTNLQGLLNASRPNRANKEASRHGPARWWWDPGEPFYTCNYCGSVHPAAVPALLTTPGAHYSGSDWKYGYPHKFYFDLPEGAMWDGSPEWHGKFYTRHLDDLMDEELDPVAFLIRGFFGVDFQREDGKLLWKALHGMQHWGTVP